MLSLKTYIRFFILISVFIYPFQLHTKELTLTKNEENSLKQFFYALLWGSQVGYVLYGKKPICFEGCSKDIFNGVFTSGHHLTVSINEGLEVWNKLKLGFDFPKFMIINQNITNNYRLILFINKDVLTHVFKEHSSLFRYKLGADLTADKLLDLLQHKDLFTVLNNDAVLLGLLLGFGFENSLHVGRLENIYDDLYFYKSVNKNLYDLFFFKCKQALPLLKQHSLKPSFNYSSLQLELEALSNKIESASPSLEFYSPQLIFGKVANCLENIEDIKHYENAQLRIIKILDEPNWLEQIFSQLFGESIHLNIIEESLRENRLSQNVEWPKVMAEVFFYKFITEFAGEIDPTFSEFLAGMEEADRRDDAHYLAPFPADLIEAYSSKEKAFLLGFKIWSFYKFNPNLFSLNKITQELIDNYKNKIDLSSLHSAIMHMQWHTFNRIDQHEQALALSYFQKFDLHFLGIKCISPNRLYYQKINKGEGPVIKEDQTLTISYILKTASGHILEEEENKLIDLKRAIKGFRQGFPNLRVGEKGILYIHPEWGIKKYLTPPYYSPYLIAEFKILSS